MNSQPQESQEVGYSRFVGLSLGYGRIGFLISVMNLGGTLTYLSMNLCRRSRVSSNSGARKEILPPVRRPLVNTEVAKSTWITGLRFGSSGRPMGGVRSIHHSSSEGSSIIVLESPEPHPLDKLLVYHSPIGSIFRSRNVPCDHVIGVSFADISTLVKDVRRMQCPLRNLSESRNLVYRIQEWTWRKSDA
jgi:hypothetical protein